MRTTVSAVVLAVVATFTSKAGAQASAAEGISPTAADALARAQRAADRVKEFILMSAKAAAVPASAPASAMRVAPRGVRAHSAASTDRVPAPPLVREGASAAARDTSSEEVRSSTPSSKTTRRTASDGALLFDFEGSTEGFALHGLDDWAELPATDIGLAPQATHGQSALQVRSPSDAWLGVDLSDAVDFSVLTHITFWMRSSVGTTARFAVKSGSQYDWCEMRPAMLGSANGFIHYAVALQTAGRGCRNFDLGDLRGLHWFVHAGDTVVLDEVALR